MASGDVVFSKDQDDECSEIWDDSALIKAYDEAVNSMKAQIASQLGEKAPVAEAPTVKQAPVNKKKHKKNRRKHRKKDKSPSHVAVSSSGQWKSGDHCRAVFTEDGQIYEAVVLQINMAEHTCRVRYLGYGNEEQQLLDDLLPSKEVDSAAKTSSECDSMEWAHIGVGSRHSPPPRMPSFPGTQTSGMGRGFVPPPPPFPPMPGAQSVWDANMPPMMPPMFPPTMSFGVPPFGNPPGPTIPGAMNMPDMPPPLTAEDEDLLESDKDALQSMLVAWYMSGYHTGYYQGLKQGRKASGKNKASNKEESAGTQPKSEDNS